MIRVPNNALYWNWLNTKGDTVSYWHTCKEIAYSKLGTLGWAKNKLKFSQYAEADGEIDMQAPKLMVSTGNSAQIQDCVRVAVDLLSGHRYASCSIHDGFALVHLDPWYVKSSVHASFAMTCIRAQVNWSTSVSSLHEMIEKAAEGFGDDQGHFAKAKKNGTFPGLLEDSLRISKFGWTAYLKGNVDGYTGLPGLHWYGMASYKDADMADVAITPEQLTKRYGYGEPIELYQRQNWSDRSFVRNSNSQV